MNDASLWVRHAQGSESEQHGQTDCVVGRDVMIRPEKIQDFCAQQLTSVEQDLVLLAGVVALADRRVPRRRGSGWCRTIHIDLPVSDPDMWSEPRILDSLLDTLRFLTGDNWAFTFRPGFVPIVSGQSALDFSNVSDVVIPFSEGLDSYSQWCLQSASSTPSSPLRIHCRSKLGNARQRRCIESSPFGRGVRLDVPISLKAGNHPEPSYRTRSFLFFVLAAVAASKVGVNRVVVGENGVSTIGPSLLPYGDEHPPVGTHPAFTSLLSCLVERVLDARIEFEHPGLFRTKGEILADALTCCADGWQHTRSCVRDYRDRLNAEHCGACSGCLMRRVALHRNARQDDRYTWTNLAGGSTLLQCHSTSIGRDVTSNDEDIASHSVHSMERLAQLGATNQASTAIKRCAWTLASGNGDRCASLSNDIALLCRSHHGEWQAFKSEVPQDSILRRFETI